MQAAALEQFFAQETDDPLRYAFQRRGAHMPGSAGEAVSEDAHQQVWQEIQRSDRSGMAVMYLHVPFCAIIACSAVSIATNGKKSTPLHMLMH